jgi:DNA-binding PadR family transcriptional regulator
LTLITNICKVNHRYQLNLFPFKEIEERTGRSVSQAAAYLTLRRLEEKGWIASRLGDPTPERGGRAKRYFRLRAAGKRRLTDARSALLEMWDGVAPQLDRS